MTPADIKPFSVWLIEDNEAYRTAALAHRHAWPSDRRAGLQVVRSRVQALEASPAFGSPGVVLLDSACPA